ncbi:MAG: 1,4-alpha-glucan branching protein, partial [Acidobacteria bacterium]
MLPLPPKASTIPLGGTVVTGGAAFRVWAPRATAVYLLGDFNQFAVDENFRLQSLNDETWAGFLAGAKDGVRYMF